MVSVINVPMFYIFQTKFNNHANTADSINNNELANFNAALVCTINSGQTEKFPRFSCHFFLNSLQAGSSDHLKNDEYHQDITLFLLQLDQTYLEITKIQKHHLLMTDYFSSSIFMTECYNRHKL